MEQTKRITYIDAAKGLGIVLIVFGHIASNDALRQYIYSFHVPVFFFLSGMTYRLKEDLAGTWKKRMSRLYLPYLIFSLISILLFCLMGKMAASRLQVNLVDGNIGSYLAGMLYANSRTGYMKWNTPLWFIPCLLATYLIADVIEMAVRKAARGGYLIRSCSIIGCLILAGIFLTCGRAVTLPFAFETAVLMYPFFSFGMLARKRSLFENVDRLRTGMKSLLSIFFYGMTGVFSYLNGKAEIRTMTMGKNFFLFLLCPLFGIAGTMLLSLCLKNRKGLCYLGRCTMSVLLMHKFPVLFLQVLMPGVRDWLEWKNIAGICCSIAVTVLVLFLCLAADRILTPIAPWMLGKPGRKKENPSSA